MSDNEALDELKRSLSEVLPKSGLVYSERGGLTEVFCKPKLLPIKSAVIEKLKKIEKANDKPIENNEEGRIGRK